MLCYVMFCYVTLCRLIVPFYFINQTFVLHIVMPDEVSGAGKTRQRLAPQAK
jgi:hypothetical protein